MKIGIVGAGRVGCACALAVVVRGSDRVAPMTVGIAEAVLQPKFDAVDIVTEVINRVENALEVAKSEGGNKAHSLAANLQPVA